MISLKEQKKIHKLFQDSEFDKLNLILNNFNNNYPNHKLVNIYLYFLYKCLHDKDKRNYQLSLIIELFEFKYDEVYYNLALTCKKLTKIRLHHLTQMDVHSYLLLSYESNPNNPETLFELGVFLIVQQRNVNDGILNINTACKIDAIYIEKKASLLKNLTVELYYPDNKNIFSNMQMYLILEQMDSLPKEHKDNFYYLQKLKLLKLTNNFEEAENQIKYIASDNESNHRFNREYYNLFIQKNDFDKSFYYAKRLNKTVQAECYYIFNYFEEALKLYKEINFEKNTFNPSINNKIAECYFELNTLEYTLKHVFINFKDLCFTHYFKDYYKSICILSKVYIVKQKYDRCIKYIDKALIVLQDHDQREYYSEYKYKLYLEKIKVYKFAHINRLKKSIKDSPEINLKDLNSIKKSIQDIESNKNYNISTKRRINYYIKEILTFTNKNNVLITKIENEISDYETSHTQECNRIIEKVITKAIKYDIFDTDLLFTFASTLHDLKKFNDSIVIYNKLIFHYPQNSTYLNNLAVAYSMSGNEKKAIETINKSLANVEIGKENFTLLENQIDFLYAQCKTNNELENTVTLLSRELIKKVIISDSKPSKFTNNGIQEIYNLKLFKYKYFNTNTLDSICNDYFYFSEISKLNDPLDIPIIEMAKKEKFDKLKIKPDDIKVLSLTEENNNTLMWSHYADSHRGICIGYNINSLPNYIGWDYINYIPENYNYEKMSIDKGLLNVGMFSKHNNWKYEKEVRLATFRDHKNKVKYNFPVMEENRDQYIEAYISEITVGYKLLESNLKILITLIADKNRLRFKKSIPPIKLYKSYLDENHPFKLNKIEIDIENIKT